PVVDYWTAAAPVVAVGAPLGAWVCTRLTPLTIRMILFVLIGAELISTLLLVHFTDGMIVLSAVTLTVFTGLCLICVRQDRYARPAESGGRADSRGLSTASAR
ncbi:sulfite exporter TauE/SafE family protein, partial [Streptomyces globisporus]